MMTSLVTFFLVFYNGNCYSRYSGPLPTVQDMQQPRTLDMRLVEASFSLVHLAATTSSLHAIL